MNKILINDHSIKNRLICPLTKDKLILEKNYFISELNNTIKYEIIDSIPILINEKNSIFIIQDFILKNNTTYNYNYKFKFAYFL